MTQLKREAKFFKDGDVNFQGVNLTISERRYQNMDTLIEELNRKVPLPYGVRTISTPTGLHQVKDLNDIEDGKRYVCSSSRKIKRLQYENIGNRKAMFKIPRPLSARDYKPFEKKETQPGSTRRKLKSLTFISNKSSEKSVTVILTNRVKNLDMILSEASDLFKEDVLTLTTMEGNVVTSLVELFRGGDTYIAEVQERTSKPRTAQANQNPNSAPPQTAAPKTPSAPAQEESPVRNVESQNQATPTKMPKTTKTPKTPKTRKAQKASAKSRNQKKSKSSRKAVTTWLMTIKTSDVENATSDNNATIVVYGSEGKTDEYVLGVPANRESYCRDSVSEVEVVLKEVGQLFKIRIGHLDNGKAFGWHLDTILLTNLRTNEDYKFVCNRWLSKVMDDGAIVREIPLMKNEKVVLPLITYEVMVYSGEYKEADSAFELSITIEGDNGDSGKRELTLSSNEKPFRSKATDIFRVECVSLGAIKNIFLMQESESDPTENTWYAEKVIIRDTKSGVEYLFPIEQPLQDKQDSPEEGKVDEAGQADNVGVTTNEKESENESEGKKKDEEDKRKEDDEKNEEDEENEGDEKNEGDEENSVPKEGNENLNEKENVENNVGEIFEGNEEEKVIPKDEANNSNELDKEENKVVESDAIKDDLSAEDNEDGEAKEVFEAKLKCSSSSKYLCFDAVSCIVHAAGGGKKCCVWNIARYENKMSIYCKHYAGFLSVVEGKITIVKDAKGSVLFKSTEQGALQSIEHPQKCVASDAFGQLAVVDTKDATTAFLIEEEKEKDVETCSAHDPIKTFEYTRVFGETTTSSEGNSDDRTTDDKNKNEDQKEDEDKTADSKNEENDTVDTRNKESNTTNALNDENKSTESRDHDEKPENGTTEKTAKSEECDEKNADDVAEDSKDVETSGNTEEDKKSKKNEDEVANIKEENPDRIDVENKESNKDECKDKSMNSETKNQEKKEEERNKNISEDEEDDKNEDVLESKAGDENKDENENETEDKNEAENESRIEDENAFQKENEIKDESNTDEAGNEINDEEVGNESHNETEDADHEELQSEKEAESNSENESDIETNEIDELRSSSIPSRSQSVMSQSKEVNAIDERPHSSPMMYTPTPPPGKPNREVPHRVSSVMDRTSRPQTADRSLSAPPDQTDTNNNRPNSVQSLVDSLSEEGGFPAEESDEVAPLPQTKTNSNKMNREISFIVMPKTPDIEEETEKRKPKAVREGSFLVFAVYDPKKDDERKMEEENIEEEENDMSDEEFFEYTNTDGSFQGRLSKCSVRTPDTTVGRQKTDNTEFSNSQLLPSSLQTKEKSFITMRVDDGKASDIEREVSFITMCTTPAPGESPENAN